MYLLNLIKVHVLSATATVNVTVYNFALLNYTLSRD